MSQNDHCKPANGSRLREGYQPSERRGYQAGLDKGYQPSVQTRGTVQPPVGVGSTAVIPTNASKTPAPAAAEKK